MLSLLSKNARLLVSLFLAICILPFFSSCNSQQDVSSADLLSAMLSASKNLPAGRIYTTKSTPGAPDYLSDDLLASLYGTDGYPSVFGRIKEISIWTCSGFYATEFAAFLCNTSVDAEEIADLCLGRIDDMRRFLNENSAKLSLDAYAVSGLNSAKVIITGRCVIMAVCADADTALNAAKEAISGNF